MERKFLVKKITQNCHVALLLLPIPRKSSESHEKLIYMGDNGLIEESLTHSKRQADLLYEQGQTLTVKSPKGGQAVILHLENRFV